MPGFRSAARQRVTYFYCIAAFEALCISERLFKGSPGTVKAALTLSFVTQKYMKIFIEIEWLLSIGFLAMREWLLTSVNSLPGSD